MVIYFDIDSTLFNTPQFAHRYLRPQLLQVLRFSEASLLTAEKTYRDSLQKPTDFNFEEYCTVLAKAGGTPTEQLLALFASRELYIHCLYPEVLEVLEELQKRECSLGIYSEGFTQFQQRKLEYTGIAGYFIPELVYVARRKLDPQVVEVLQPGSLVVDDNLEYIDGLLSSKATPVWINRVDDLKHEQAQTITDLTQLFEMF